ncbi:MAG: DUF58 domain-containing protein [Acidobacteriota bacterium]
MAELSRELRQAVRDGERAASRYALALPRGATVGGTRLGRASGSSLEFQEHRAYQPGDDLRHLDWSAYARSDRLIVKLYREEVQPHVDLLLDGSRSMDLAGSAKARAVVGLAAFLARAATHAGLSHVAWLANSGCRRLAPPGQPADQWRGVSFEGREALPVELARQAPRWRPGGIRIVLSDLLWDDAPRQLLGQLARGASAVWVVQVLAAVDADPTSAGFCRLVDTETGEARELLLDTASIERYRKAFEAHRASWRGACRGAGAELVAINADELSPESPAGWSHEALGELERRGLVTLSMRRAR